MTTTLSNSAFHCLPKGCSSGESVTCGALVVAGCVVFAAVVNGSVVGGTVVDVVVFGGLEEGAFADADSSSVDETSVVSADSDLAAESLSDAQPAASATATHRRPRRELPPRHDPINGDVHVPTVDAAA